MCKRLAAMLSLLACAPLVGAMPSVSGEDLAKGLKQWHDVVTTNSADKEAPISAGMVLGYVQGIAEMQDDRAFCTHGRIGSEKATLTVYKYIKKHPEVTRLKARTIVHKAMEDAYACQK